MAKIGGFSDKNFTESVKLAQTAQKTADKAKDLAGTADGNIKTINDPNYLSPFEKPQLQVQMDNFATIYAADKDIATSEGIDFAAYDAAYQAYLAYMTPLIADMTTYSPIVRSTFNSMVTAVQAEQKRFNAATQAQYNQQINKAQTDIDDGQTKYKALHAAAEAMKNSMVKKGDVVNQFNIDAGGALLSTSGNSTKIVFSSPNIIFDSKNPVQIPNANIPGTLTGKTIEAGTITANTKIFGSDIEAPIIHSPNGSFKLDGKTGDIIGASIHSADNSWGIDKNGKIRGIKLLTSAIDISGDGSGDIDMTTVSAGTSQGIYSRYSYVHNNGYDINHAGESVPKSGIMIMKGDNLAMHGIIDWSSQDDDLYNNAYVEAVQMTTQAFKARAFSYTGTNVLTDDPIATQGDMIRRVDITPFDFTMGTNWSKTNPNVHINAASGSAKFGTIAFDGNNDMGSTDGGDIYFRHMNNNMSAVSRSAVAIRVEGIHTSNLGLNGGHILSSADGGDIYVEDTYNSGGHAVNLHVKKLYQSSLLSLKTDIKPIDPNTALETINNTDFMSYHFKNDKSNEPISVSPILDDINPIPKYNTPDIFKSADGDSRNDGNILGYTALAVKALYAKVQDLNSRLQKLEGAN